MEQSTGGAIPKRPRDIFFKNVLLLKKSDFQRIGGQVYMPTESEISTIKTNTRLEQFKKEVQFSASMSEGKIKKTLQASFPYLENKRFSCAGVVKLDKESKRFEFYGASRVWNGKTIRSKIKGNSTLYVLEDETSLLPGDSQMETDDADDGQRGIQGDDNVALQSDSNNNKHQDQLQMSDSSEEDFSSTATTSGIGGEYSEGAKTFKSSDNNTRLRGNPESNKSEYITEEVSDLVQWLQSNVDYEVFINPRCSPLQGGAPCRFTFSPELQPEITSGRAKFGNAPPVELERLKNGSLLGSIPASPVPGWVPVIVESEDGVRLGQTEIEYQGDPMEAALQQIVLNPSLQQRLFWQMLGRLCGNTETSGSEAQNYRSLGFTQPVQMLSLLVYAAAENGDALPFIEMIFTSSAGRVVFTSYKDNITLPEIIARNHGNEETANYLEDITKRFSEEIRTGNEYSQAIDWLELAKAAEAAQKQLDHGSENDALEIEKDMLKETGYSGDEDTCSTESPEPQKTNSEDNISTTSSKEAELSFILPSKSSNELITELETRRKDLGNASYGASVTTMEEVLLKFGEEMDSTLSDKLQQKDKPGSSEMTMGNLVYNSHGKKNAVPRQRVSSIYELERGDHIAFPLNAGLWHHAIVEYVDYENDQLDVIHYTNTAEGFMSDIFSSTKRPGIASVVQDSLEFDELDVYKIKHERCVDPDIVVMRARSKLRERKYNPPTNNCEHFAMWCKTGLLSSEKEENTEEVIANITNKIASSAEAVIKASIERITAIYDINRVQEDMKAACRVDVDNVIANVGGAFAGVAIGQALIPVPILGGVSRRHNRRSSRINGSKHF